MSQYPPFHREIGGYQVLREIRSGGMGSICFARKVGVHGFEKQVALKTIRTEHHEKDQFRTMFLDEARLMARLHHPGIAQVHDFGQEGDLLFLAMEYVAGINFRDLIDKQPPPVVAARAVADVCLALHTAHELTDVNDGFLGVVHRDISPENLMLDFDGKTKVLDFGIALVRDRETRSTQLGQVKGKPAYMSPEQVRNQPIDRRSDIFSLSIVLHELLTGQRLFAGDSLYSVALAISSANVHPPSRLAPHVPQALDDIVMRGLQIAPADRFATAQEMEDALNQFANGAGGETLRQYAGRALADELQAHREWMRSTLLPTSAHEPLPPGRPDGIGTVPLMMPIPTSLSQAAALGEDRKPLPNTETRPNRRLALMGAGLLVLLAVGILGWWLGSGANPSSLVERPAPTAVGPEPLSFAPPVAPLTRAAAQGTGPLPASPPAQTAAPIRPPPPQHHPASARSQSRAGTIPKTIADAPTAPPTAVSYGNVTCVAEPYANVLIDGAHLGATPIFNHSLPVGEHQVVFLNPDDDSVRLRRVVRVAEGSHTRISNP